MSASTHNDEFDVGIWFPSYPGDHFKETHHLSNEEKGIYCDFLHEFWNNNHALKDADKHLARRAHVSLRKWKSIRPNLAPFFFIKDDCWWSKRLYSEIPKAKLNRMQKQLAAYIRYENTDKVEEIKRQMEEIKHAGAYASASDESMRVQCPSPSPSPAPSPLPSVEGGVQSGEEVLQDVLQEKKFVCDESTGELIEQEVSDELH